MWFKNIQFYRFEEPFRLSGQQLHEKLSSLMARACGQMETEHVGWISPLGAQGEMLVHENSGNLMICLRREEKVVPASLVREEVSERIMQIEAQQGRPVGRKEKIDIRDEVMQRLLPRALVKSAHTYAVIMPRQGWLVINASSAKKCDEVIEVLRKCLGVLPVVIPGTEQSPESAMTGWLADETNLPGGFMLEDSCELSVAREQQASIRCSRIYIDEAREHLAAGYTVKKLAMNWNERLSFVLAEDLSVRSMKFDSVVVEEAGDGSMDDDAARFDADFAIMCGELEGFIPALLSALGGAVSQA